MTLVTTLVTMTDMTRSESCGFGGILMITGALMVGCPTADPDGGDGAGGTGDTEGQMPNSSGIKIKCCYTLARLTPGTAPVYEQACIHDNSSPCIDPKDTTIDTNGSGNLDTKEIVTNICSKKCPSLPGGYPFYGGPFHEPGNELVGVASGPWDGCVPTTGSIIQSAPTCDPSLPGQLDPWDFAPLSHEGTFTSGMLGNQASVKINGITLAVDYDGTFVFSVDNCISVDEREECTLELVMLDLELVGNPVFGDYEVDGAFLSLARPQAATANFTCGSTGCQGTFDFHVEAGNALEMNLSWDQTRISTQTIGGGSMLLSNGPLGLGGLTKVQGELDLDATKSTGTLRLYGHGADAFGGDIASTNFDLTGSVGRYVP